MSESEVICISMQQSLEDELRQYRRYRSDYKIMEILTDSIQDRGPSDLHMWDTNTVVKHSSSPLEMKPNTMLDNPTSSVILALMFI
ncbi:hypothetical protein SK128_017154 [Halocaridina rubra]|uniref:Uncharacterized protein n=1 Tax=Halocaridina rubra TaxID=373956 RepID=A0AAN8WT43_HALRR